MTSDGIFNYGYDKNGNLVLKRNISTGEMVNYSYNNKNQLIGVSDQTTGLQGTYQYDAPGQRIEANITSGGTTTDTRFSFSGGQIWADLNSSNSLVTRYVAGLGVDEKIARVTSGGTVSWLAADRQLSIRYVLDASGNTLDTITYDPYGALASESSPGTVGAYQWQGLRWFFADQQLRGDSFQRPGYSPATGEFDGRDPIMDGTNWTIGFLDNPTNRRDPSGLASWDIDANKRTITRVISLKFDWKNYPPSKSDIDAAGGAWNKITDNPDNAASEWDDKRKRDFSGNAKRIIEEMWNTNKVIILAYTKPVLTGWVTKSGDIVIDTEPKCLVDQWVPRVEVNIVDSGADATIKVLAAPKPLEGDDGEKPFEVGAGGHKVQLPLILPQTTHLGRARAPLTYDVGLEQRDLFWNEQYVNSRIVGLLLGLTITLKDDNGIVHLVDPTGLMGGGTGTQLRANYFTGWAQELIRASSPKYEKALIIAAN
jgi:YD repeat-containing protein